MTGNQPLKPEDWDEWESREKELFEQQNRRTTPAMPSPDDIDHDRARRIAAFEQPKHVLAGPYMDLTEKLEATHRALRQIGAIVAEPGEEGAIAALIEAKRIAIGALPERKIPFAKLKDVQGK